MTTNWGGKRDNAGSGGKREGAGRKPTIKFKNTRIAYGDNVVIEREMLGELPYQPEIWELVTVQDGFIEFQRTVDGSSEIMTISTVKFWNGE